MSALQSRQIDFETEHASREFLARIANRYELAGALLFGSRARGTHQRDSDADIAILLSGDRPDVMKVAIDLSDVAFDVLLETGINISPLPIWVEDWLHPEQSSNPDLLHNIAKDGIAL